MTRHELERIAKSRGFVRWTRSRKIERLHFTEQGQVTAENVVTGRRNIIYNRKENWCVEVDPATRIKLGDLL